MHENWVGMRELYIAVCPEIEEQYGERQYPPEIFESQVDHLVASEQLLHQNGYVKLEKTRKTEAGS